MYHYDFSIVRYTSSLLKRYSMSNFVPSTKGTCNKTVCWTHAPRRHGNKRCCCRWSPTASQVPGSDECCTFADSLGRVMAWVALVAP